MSKINFHNEDSFESIQFLPNNHFDLAIIDPPYGIGEDGGKSAGRCKKTGVKPNNFKKKNWDKSSPEKDFFVELKRVSKNQIIFGANHFIENIPKANSSCWIVWDKDNGTNDFADCELAYSSFKTAVRKYRFKWHGMLQEDMKNKEVRIYPTQKPVKLYEWLLMNYATTGDKILDTHGGSMSIALVCHNLGFDLDIYEIDREYFDNGVKRYRDHIAQTRLF